MLLVYKVNVFFLLFVGLTYHHFSDCEVVVNEIEVRRGTWHARNVMFK